jgi:hypothetical protein
MTQSDKEDDAIGNAYLAALAREWDVFLASSSYSNMAEAKANFASAVSRARLVRDQALAVLILLDADLPVESKEKTK